MKKYQLDSISVKSPCSENWDEMSGNDKVRFCSHCAKSVHNFSAMTRTEINKLVEKSNGKLCVRYIKTPQGKLVTAAPRIRKIKKQSVIAASVLASSLALSTAVHAQGKPVLKNETVKTQTDNPDKANRLQNDSILSGIVMDSTGAVIPGAKITLRNIRTGKIQITQSSAEGFYEFRNTEPDVYQLEAESLGFIKAVWKDIEILGDVKLEKNISLEVGQANIGVVVVVD